MADHNIDQRKEGWGSVPNVSRKWHYFAEDGRSLCRRFLALHRNFEQGNDGSPDNCAACRRKLEARAAPDA